MTYICSVASLSGESETIAMKFSSSTGRENINDLCKPGNPRYCTVSAGHLTFHTMEYRANDVACVLPYLRNPQLHLYSNYHCHHAHSNFDSGSSALLSSFYNISFLSCVLFRSSFNLVKGKIQLKRFSTTP